MVHTVMMMAARLSCIYGACSKIQAKACGVVSLSGVNYFFALTTIISPDQRQLLF